jgi:nondiscriminating glutamyl-tRNA synthetase
MAPSPTGHLHIGGARTALFNYFFAKHYKGTFVLRIEDTDPERSKKEYEQSIIEDLKWLGIEWDEGPLVKGAYGSYYQSERNEIYRKYYDELVARQRVYPCYCTPEELEEERSGLLRRRQTPRYMGKCRNLNGEQKRTLEREGRKPVLRFRIDEKDPIRFHDLVRGDIEVDPAQLGDFVISRPDGAPVYNFSAAIDDHEMAITHVIRGEEHISNTPRQILLFNALGFDLPNYAHVSIILAPDRTKLSKRHGATSVGEYRKIGFLPDALVNYLSLLGWNPGDEREVMTKEEIIRDFVIEKMTKSPAIFDLKKLTWMNGVYIRQKPVPELACKSYPFLKEKGYPLEDKDPAWLNRVVEACKTKLETLDQIGEEAAVFFDEQYQLSDDAKKWLLEKKSEAADILQTLDDLLSKAQEIDQAAYEKIQSELRKKTSIAPKILFMTQRFALTGKISGHEMNLIFTILGAESCRKRIHKALLMLK